MEDREVKKKFRLSDKQVQCLRHIFDQFDISHSDSLGKQELSLLMTKYESNLSDNELVSLLHEYDINHNGTLSFMEFCGMMKSTAEEQQKHE